MSLGEMASNLFWAVAPPSVPQRSGFNNAWVLPRGVEQEHAQMSESIQGTTQKEGFVPRRPAGTAIVIQPSGPKDAIYYLVELEPSAFAQESIQKWTQRHKGKFEDPLEDLFRQHDIKSIGQPEGIFSIQKSIREWLAQLSWSEYGQMFLSVRLFIREQIENRLRELRQAPYDPEEEEPLNPKSVRLFVEFCRRKKLNGLPDITATPDGIVSTDWEQDEDWVGMRFLSNGKIWIAINKGSSKGSFETTIDELFSPDSNIRLPEWI